MKVVTRRVSGGNCFGSPRWRRRDNVGFLWEGKKQEQIHGASKVYRPEMLNCSRTGNDVFLSRRDWALTVRSSRMGLDFSSAPQVFVSTWGRVWPLADSRHHSTTFAVSNQFPSTRLTEGRLAMAEDGEGEGLGGGG
jgi:hypothetical protein